MHSESTIYMSHHIYDDALRVYNMNMYLPHLRRCTPSMSLTSEFPPWSNRILLGQTVADGPHAGEADDAPPVAQLRPPPTPVSSSAGVMDVREHGHKNNTDLRHVDNVYSYGARFSRA